MVLFEFILSTSPFRNPLDTLISWYMLFFCLVGMIVTSALITWKALMCHWKWIPCLLIVNMIPSRGIYCSCTWVMTPSELAKVLFSILMQVSLSHFLFCLLMHEPFTSFVFLFMLLFSGSWYSNCPSCH